MRWLSVAVLCIALSFSSCAKRHPSYCGDEPQIGAALKPSTDTERYLLNTDFSKYIGLTIDDLAHEFPVKQQRLNGIDEPPGQLIGVGYIFDGGYTIKVYVSEFRYTERNGKPGEWNFANIGKEEILGIVVNHHGSDEYYLCKEFW